MTKPPFWAGSWYFLITVASFGLLAWVPFVHAANRLRRRSIVVLAVIYGTASAIQTALLSLSSGETPEQASSGARPTIGLIMFVFMLSVVAGGCVQQALLRREVYGTTPRTVGGPAIPTGTDPALAAALAARARRGTARQLAAGDPLIARDLRIGRPDLPHTYDDGGLVDFNTAPATVIAQICGLPAAAADKIVTARETCGGYLTVDDVFTLAEIPISTWDAIRDRGIVISVLR
jgi:hypothetical protein